MSSGNWIVDNLNNALETWNEKLSEIWQLVTQSPENFKGGAIWSVMVSTSGSKLLLDEAIISQSLMRGCLIQWLRRLL